MSRSSISVLVALVGCQSHEVTGSGLILSMQPTAPTFAGQFDFDLGPRASADACLTRPTMSAPPFGKTKVYWVIGSAFEKLPRDPLTAQAIAVAAFRLVDATDADSLVITRIVAEPKNGTDEICATVYGRSIKLKKASEPVRPTEPPPAEPEPEAKP